MRKIPVCTAISEPKRKIDCHTRRYRVKGDIYLARSVTLRHITEIHATTIEKGFLDLFCKPIISNSGIFCWKSEFGYSEILYCEVHFLSTHWFFLFIFRILNVDGASVQTVSLYYWYTHLIEKWNSCYPANLAT